MFSLSLMTAKAKAIAVIFVLAAAFGVGWKVSAWKHDAEFNAYKLSVAQDKNQALTDSLESFKTLDATIAALDDKWFKESKNVQDKIDDLSRDYLSGNKQLSVLIKKRSDSTAVPGVSSPSVGDGKETAELDGSVAAGLTRLTGEGDGAIIQLSACQEILQAVQQRDKEALQKALQRAQEAKQ